MLARAVHLSGDKLCPWVRVSRAYDDWETLATAMMRELHAVDPENFIILEKVGWYWHHRPDGHPFVPAESPTHMKLVATDVKNVKTVYYVEVRV